MIVRIANGNQLNEVEAVEVHGVWAVTPVIGTNPRGEYHVTHAPTGLAIGGPMTLRNASAFARDLAARWPDWEAGHATVNDATRSPVPPREVGEFVRDWRPPSPTRAGMVADLLDAVDAGKHDRAREIVSAIRAVPQ